MEEQGWTKPSLLILLLQVVKAILDLLNR